MKKQPYHSMIYWNITDMCNFSCPHCIGHARKITTQYAPEKIDIPGLRGFLQQLRLPARFHLTGGEPLIVENFVQGLKEITREHYFSLITNLVRPNAIEIAHEIDPGKAILIIASAHTIELEQNHLLDTFLYHCKLLLKNNFNLKVIEVGYPFRMHKVAYYRNLFYDNGIKLYFDPFRGQWNGKIYPEDYTEEEMELLKLDPFMPTSSEAYRRKDKLCNAGYNIAMVSGDGKIQPCMFIKKDMGHIYDKVHFSNELVHCPLDFCPCPYPVFFPDLYKKARRANWGKSIFGPFIDKAKKLSLLKIG
jgi:MoaA/NifB/PqqE/SkfB family radical SAM enzyme